ncbi:hypothetical protein OG936_38345 (plasmid) [Streptomyces sp. NBC_00846]|uniref:hypothetical protein n=1 Tax=Streptomyces sp. NBC_00846 TaxID=2975849 RepID=UPI002F90CB24|nr:hypothetical protein OG936_38345 [Streptomyces sp. NBC_00846]
MQWPHRAVAPPSWADPAIAEAVDRQNQAMRELSRRAFPEPEVVPYATSREFPEPPRSW